MSLWQYSAAVQGWIDAHSPEAGEMNSAEQESVWAMVESKMGRVQ